MKKEARIQKKKTPFTKFLDILFKGLVGVAAIIFLYIAYDKVDFSSNKLSITPKKKSSVSSSAPSELKWFNDFRGIENVPNKNAKKSSSSGNTGFKYEGFKK